MNNTYLNSFEKVKEQLKILGFEKKFINLGQETGPTNPPWTDKSVIYEIYVRAFSEEGSFKAVEQALPRLKKLGVNVLWFMPIFPIGEKERKGSLGCPYSIKDYFTVNPEYGTEQDFKELVQAAHENGMKVLIDMVANHVAHDYKYLKETPNLISYDEHGKPKRKIANWSDVVDLDYSKPETRAHMADVMKYWIEHFDIDGYRCDVAGLVPLDFWEWVTPQLHSLKPDLFLLAEWESQQLHEKVFNSSYDWSTLELLLKAFANPQTLPLLAQWLVTKTAIYPRNALPLRFIENHDLPRSAQRLKRKQLKSALLFIFSLHGIPLIYNGQEIGAKHTPSLFAKETIDWQNADHEISLFMQKLISLRQNEAGLRSNQYAIDESYLSQGILCLYKEDLQIIINFNPVSQLIDLPDGKELLNTVEELNFTGRKLDLQPYQGILLKNQLF